MKRTLLLLTGLLVMALLPACSTAGAKQDTVTPQWPEGKITKSSMMLVPYDVDALVRESDCILIGKVVEILPPAENDTGMSEEQVQRGMDVFRVYTDVLIQPERVLVGEIDPAALVTVRVWGGQVGDVEFIVEEEATFAAGDESLLFLRAPGYSVLTPVPDGIKPPSYFVVKGFLQGKYEYRDGIATNARTESTITISDLEAKISSLRG